MDGCDGLVGEEAFVKEGAFDEDVGQGIVGVPHEEDAVAGWLAGEVAVGQEVGNWHEGEGEGDAETCWEVQLEGWGGHLC